MNRAAFWKLIDATRLEDRDGDAHVENLGRRLRKMTPEEIAAFEHHMLELKDEAYDARLLEVLWILTGGGPGDEGWSDFTSWLILQGRTSFERILKTPERLPEFYPPGTTIYAGGLSSTAIDAFEEVAGDEDFDTFFESHHGAYTPPRAPKGAKRDPRTEDEEVLEKRLRKKHPDLWKYEAQYD